MSFSFKKNNKKTKKPDNRFLQDDASAGIQSLQTSIEIKLIAYSIVEILNFESLIKRKIFTPVISLLQYCFRKNNGSILLEFFRLSFSGFSCFVFDL